MHCREQTFDVWEKERIGPGTRYSMSGSRPRATRANASVQSDDLKTTYGFRYDPLEWLVGSRSVQAAQIRTCVLDAPNRGDKTILAGEIDRILTSSSLGDGELIRLSRLGCSPTRRQVKKALKSQHSESESTVTVGIYGLQTAYWAGCRSTSVQRSAEELLADVMKMDFGGGCPWSGQVHLQGLWAIRDLVNISGALEHGLRIVLDSIQEAGWAAYKDPWGFLDCAGAIGHPLAREIVIKLLPMILRAQEPDGSWGGMKHFGYGPESRTYVVFRALAKWVCSRSCATIRRYLPTGMSGGQFQRRMGTCLR